MSDPKKTLTILLASPRGFCAGASARERLVDESITACRARQPVTVEKLRTTQESVFFKLPRQLVA